MKRRNFLRGAGGIAVALPMLESMLPRRARAADDGTPRRFVGFCCCNGVEITRFWPTSPYGALTAAGLAGTALEPLSAHVDKMLVPRGIHTVPRGFGWDPVAGCDHVKGVGHRLTARPLDEGTLYATGASLDQVIATQRNDGGTPALNLHVGYRYQGTNGVVSYTGANGPAVGENNPWLVYQDLMGLSNLDDVAIMRLTARRESVLDLVERDFNRIGGGSISQADRAKLDMHLTAIRDLEVGMGEAGLIPCMLDDGRVSELQALEGANVDADSEYKRIGLLQMDILALALACGANHAATLMWGSEAGGPVFTWDGMSHQYNHHKLSHGNTADDCSGSAVDGYLDMLFDIDRWYATQLAYLLDQLDAYTEGDGTVLDHTAVMWTNNLSDGKAHHFMDMPYVMFGSCGGYLRTGQYIKVTAQDSTVNDVDAPHNKLLTTIANACGVTDDTGGPLTIFGDPAFAEAGEFDALKA
ncbi:MAG: DUF1552 domain-containing protein [Deltaproteobacteria bacterium]|nr:DUF1552 domain-containing protein [Deltaproteobacteria bacterium]MBK8241559.1 DUF1552 domain-containing protein [Deltaproteobacteria bacterium]MBP7289847.1 DUF1552 domain-containing protein [Nannocystaceae bacterium]